MLTFKFRSDPEIPIRFSNKGKRQTLAMLIDSGSSCSFIPIDFAKYLGLDLTAKAEKVNSMSGSFYAIPTEVTVSLGRGSSSDRFTLDVYVPRSSKIDYSTLGIHNFFERYEVTINAKTYRIKLKRTT